MDLIKTSGMENELMHSASNVTVFVPSNDAIDDFRHDMEEVSIITTYFCTRISVFYKIYN